MRYVFSRIIPVLAATSPALFAQDADVAGCSRLDWLMRDATHSIAEIELNGVALTLDLQPHSVRGPDFQVLVEGGEGTLRPVPAVAPATWRGEVRELQGSIVVATLQGEELRAAILRADGGGWELSPGVGRSLRVRPSNAAAASA